MCVYFLKLPEKETKPRGVGEGFWGAISTPTIYRFYGVFDSPSVLKVQYLKRI